MCSACSQNLRDRLLWEIHSTTRSEPNDDDIQNTYSICYTCHLKRRLLKLDPLASPQHMIRRDTTKNTSKHTLLIFDLRLWWFQNPEVFFCWALDIYSPLTWNVFRHLLLAFACCFDDTMFRVQDWKRRANIEWLTNGGFDVRIHDETWLDFVEWPPATILCFNNTHRSTPIERSLGNSAALLLCGQ